MLRRLLCNRSRINHRQCRGWWHLDLYVLLRLLHPLQVLAAEEQVRADFNDCLLHYIYDWHEHTNRILHSVVLRNTAIHPALQYRCGFVRDICHCRVESQSESYLAHLWSLTRQLWDAWVVQEAQAQEARILIQLAGHLDHLHWCLSLPCLQQWTGRCDWATNPLCSSGHPAPHY